MVNPFDQGYYLSEELNEMGFKSIGENVRIAKNCTIIGLGSIEIGSNVRIDGNTTIVANDEPVTIGNYVHIATACQISGGGGVQLGNFTALASGTRLYSGTDDYMGGCFTNPTVPEQYLSTIYGKIKLSDHAILGAYTVVLPGIDVAEGTATGSMTLLTKNTEVWSLYCGVPARKIAERPKPQHVKEVETRLLSMISV